MENNNEVNQDEILVNAKIMKRTKAIRNDAVILSTIFGLYALGSLVASAIYSADVQVQNSFGACCLGLSYCATFFAYEVKKQQAKLKAMRDKNPELSRKKQN